MGVRSYGRVVRAYWLVITICVVAGLCVAGAVTLTQAPRYASDFTVVLAPPVGGTPSETYDGQVLATEKAKSYSQLVSGGVVAGQVVDALQLPMTPSDLADDITFTLQPDTAVIGVQVTAGDPQTAQRIATSVSERYSLSIDALERPADSTATPALSVRVVEPPTLDPQAISPRPALAFGLGAVLGLLVGLGIALGIERSRRPVRTAEEIEEVVPVLGSVRLVTDLTEYLPPPPFVATVDEAYRRVRSRLVLDPRPGTGGAIAVVSAQSGDGRSTVAVGLAVALSRAGRGVTLVDADLGRPRISEAIAPDELPWPGLTEVVGGGSGIESALRRRPSSSLAVMPAGAPPFPESDLLASGAFRSALGQLGRPGGVVVVDTPALDRTGAALDVVPHCFGVVVVVSRGRTGRDELNATVAAVRSVGGRVLGAVLADRPSRSARRASSRRVAASAPEASVEPAPPAPQPDAGTNGATRPDPENRTSPVTPEARAVPTPHPRGDRVST